MRNIKASFQNDTNTYNVVSGSTFSDEFTETLPSAMILLSQETHEVNIQPFDFCRVYEIDSTGKKTFERFYVVDNFQKKIINSKKIMFEYTINLCNPLKIFENVQLPNLSITRKADGSIPKIKEYINNLMNLYSPKIKMAQADNNWGYVPLIFMGLQATPVDFSLIECPEMSWSNPTLKEVITSLLLYKSCLPIINNRTLEYFLLEKNDKTFNNKGLISVVESATSNGYNNSLKTDVVNCLSDYKICSEVLGFRDKENVLLKQTENLYLTTRFPIYEVKKLMFNAISEIKDLTFGYTDNLANKSYELKVNAFFPLNYDITKLVVENQKRQYLDVDFRAMTSDKINNLDDLAKWIYGTVGYSIGDNKITGFSTIYSEADLWRTKDTTYIENMTRFIYSFVMKDTNYQTNITKILVPALKQYVKDKFGATDITITKVDYTGKTIEIATKSGRSTDYSNVFFELEYIGMISGNISHTKDINFDYKIEQIDNQQSGIVSLESFCKSEKEKANRIGNPIIQASSQISTLGDLNDLGTEISDSIIFSRNYSIFNDYILVNYNATKNFVLKTYFTSIATKYRATAIESYENSIARKDNRTFYCMIDEYYITDDDVVKFGDYQYSNLYEKACLLSGAEYGNDLYKIKNAVYTTTSPTNALYQDNSIVYATESGIAFTMEMFDNATAGVYVPDWEKKYVSYNNLAGTPQKWATLDIKDKDNSGYARNLYCSFVGTIGFDNILTPYADGTGILEATNSFTTQLAYMYDLPFLTNMYSISGKYGKNIATISFGDEAMGKNTKWEVVYKDNKEILNRTYQFEFFTNNKYIKWTNLFFKLNNFIGRYEKNENTLYVRLDNSTSNILLSQFVKVIKDKAHPYIEVVWKGNNADKIGVYWNNQLVIEFYRHNGNVNDKYYISVMDTKSEKVYDTADGYILTGMLSYQSKKCSKNIDERKFYNE